MKVKRINLLMIVFTLIAGCLSTLVGEIILSSIHAYLPNCILMGIYFGILALFIAIACFLAELINPALNGHGWRSNYYTTSLKFLALTSLGLVFVIATILQFIYGINFSVQKDINDVVLLIDISQSMEQTDPTNERFAAVKNLLNDMNSNNRVAISVFNDKATMVSGMDYVDTKLRSNIDSKLSIYNVPSGKTNIKDALNKASQLIQKTKKKHRSAMIILLTDGEDNYGLNDNLDQVLRPYRNNKIPINTIGMYQGDYMFLDTISNRTNGKYYNIQNVDSLKTIFSKIYDSREQRTLVGRRTGPLEHDPIYVILRILFITLIGGFIGFGIGLMFDNKYIAKMFTISGGISGIFAGLTLELGYIYMPQLGILHRFFSCCILAVIISIIPVTINIETDNSIIHSANITDSDNLNSPSMSNKIFK